AAAQWTLSYAPGDVVSVNVAPGTVLAAAGKTVSCASKTGSTRCLAVGTNTTAIGNGVIAVVTVKLSPSAGATVPSAISNLVGVQSNGMATPVAGTGGSLTVQSSPPTVSQLQCSPASIGSGASATCTVTMSKAAPAAVTVALSDNSAALTVPASVS